MVLPRSPIKIWGKSVQGFLSYDRTTKQTKKDNNFIYIEIRDVLQGMYIKECTKGMYNKGLSSRASCIWTIHTKTTGLLYLDWYRLKYYWRTSSSRASCIWTIQTKEFKSGLYLDWYRLFGVRQLIHVYNLSITILY